MYSKYPNAFYRVSIKAIVRNDRGEVLVVHEKDQEAWNLPGGGMDHGETAHEALRRELYEEALIDSPFTEKIIATEPMYLAEKEAWQLWLVYEVDVENLTYGVGEDAREVKFVDPGIFRGSTKRSEQLIFKYVGTGTNSLS